MGGDIPAIAGGAVPNSEDVGGRESNDADSRAGRSGSDPNMAEIDMLLPGRWDWLFGASRESRDDVGAFADCDREA